MTNTGRTDRPTISAYILLSEPVQFSTSEIEDALQADYPGLDMGADGLDLAKDCDTDRFITAPLFFGASGPDACGTICLIRLPGYGTWDPAQLAPHQSFPCPDLVERLAQNRSYICVSVGAKSIDLADTFRAARTCSAIASVFAKLPVALAVYWEPAHHFLPPKTMIKATESAVCDEWPILSWISFPFGKSAESDMITGDTLGLKVFRGTELSLTPAPITPQDSLEMLFAVSTMMLEYGSEYRDGDTIGMEGETELIYRFRYLPAGQEDNEEGVLLLIHPDSTYDAETRLGPPLMSPAPPGVNNRRPVKDGFFKRLIRRQAAQ